MKLTAKLLKHFSLLWVINFLSIISESCYSCWSQTERKYICFNETKPDVCPSVVSQGGNLNKILETCLQYLVFASWYMGKESGSELEPGSGRVMALCSDRNTSLVSGSAESAPISLFPLCLTDGGFTVVSTVPRSCELLWFH